MSYLRYEAEEGIAPVRFQCYLLADREGSTVMRAAKNSCVVPTPPWRMAPTPPPHPRPYSAMLASASRRSPSASVAPRLRGSILSDPGARVARAGGGDIEGGGSEPIIAEDEEAGIVDCAGSSGDYGTEPYTAEAGNAGTMDGEGGDGESGHIEISGGDAMRGQEQENYTTFTELLGELNGIEPIKVEDEEAGIVDGGVSSSDYATEPYTAEEVADARADLTALFRAYSVDDSEHTLPMILAATAIVLQSRE